MWISSVIRRFLFLALILWAIVLPAAAQSAPVVTAGAFFKSLSDRYARITDYEAHVDIVSGKSQMQANLSCKGQLLRLDFTSPRGQTIVFNGDALVVYLPGLSAVLQQTCDASGSASLGLSLISRYYTVQYAKGSAHGRTADAGAAEDGEAASASNVVTLVAYPRGASEAFRSITIDVDADNLLVTGITAASRRGDDISMKFSEYSLNTGMASERFVYDPPSSANYYNNFLAGNDSD